MITMNYTELANTGIRVSKICLGTMTFGTPVGEPDAIRLVHYARDRGINFIDTANMYEGYARVAGSSGGVAEEIIGKAVKGNRAEYVIATKLGMKVGPGLEDEFTSPAAIQTQLDRSLRRLATDYVDLYYLHKYDPSTPPEVICEAMESQRKAGKLRAWAVSNYTAAQLAALLDAARATGVSGPVMCQPKLNLIQRDALSELLPLCERRGVAVVPYQILEGGVLTGKYKRGECAPEGSRAAEKPDWVNPISNELYDRLEGWEVEAKARKLTMSQYAIQWALAQPAVVSALVGVKQAAQIDDAAAIGNCPAYSVN